MDTYGGIIHLCLYISISDIYIYIYGFFNWVMLRFVNAENRTAFQ